MLVHLRRTEDPPTRPEAYLVGASCVVPVIFLVSRDRRPVPLDDPENLEGVAL